MNTSNFTLNWKQRFKKSIPASRIILICDQDSHVNFLCAQRHYPPSIWVFHNTRFYQIIWQISTQGRAKKYIKNCPQWGWNPWPLDLHSNALATELSQHSVASLNLHGLYKVMLYWFQKWTKFNMWSGAWNKKAHFRSLQPNRFLPGSVGRAVEWWSGGQLFHSYWGQFLTIFFLFPAWRDNLIIWQKHISWKTRLFSGNKVCMLCGLCFYQVKLKGQMKKVVEKSNGRFCHITLLLYVTLCVNAAFVCGLQVGVPLQTGLWGGLL